MTDTNPRDLIQSLSDALDNAIRVIECEDGTQHIDTARPVLAEARAYLDQPEPEVPTNEELDRFADEIWRGSPRQYARAVLARWGK